MDEATRSIYESLNIKPREDGIQWGPAATPAPPAAETPVEDVSSPEAEEHTAEPETVVNETVTEEPAADETEQTTEEDTGSVRPELTREERANNAARRRRAQERAAVDAALKAEREANAAFEKKVLARAGFRDGDKLIESVEELDKYLERMEDARIARDLKDGKLELGDLRSVVNRIVTQTEQPQVSPPEQQSVRETSQQEFAERVAEELADIRKYNSDIQSVEDLRKLERFEEFSEAVRNHNMSFLEAYRYVYADKIAQEIARKTAAAQVQRIRNSTKSRDHMRPVNGKGSGAVPVSAEKAAAYRAVMPNMTNEEIRRAEDRARVRWGNKPSP